MATATLDDITHDMLHDVTPASSTSPLAWPSASTSQKHASAIFRVLSSSNRGRRRRSTRRLSCSHTTSTTTGFSKSHAGRVFLNNRYLDPVLGRFVSVDPLIDLTRDAYGYARNNPISLSDPSGLCVTDDGGDARSRCINHQNAVPRGSGGPGSGETNSGGVGGSGSAPVLGAPSVGDASNNLAIASGKKAGQEFFRGVDFVTHQKTGIDFGDPDVQRATVELLKALSVMAARKALEFIEFGRRPDYVVVEVSAFCHCALGGGGFVTWWWMGVE
jgi:RHS repeat-associated protein